VAVSLKLPIVIADDDDLVRISRQNPGYQFELEEDGTLTVSPNYTMGGARSGIAYSQLAAYARRVGGQAFGSSVGFKIGSRGAVKSPDASWVNGERIAALTADERAKFWPLSPDVAIEIRPWSDDFRDTVAKIEFYMRHGSQYVVAIDSTTREVVELGESPEGLVLDFDAIIDA